MSVYDLILQRRTCRRFEQCPVPHELLDRLLDAGRLAPVAANIQPLEFLAVDDPAVCAQLFPHTAWAGYLENGAPPQGERPTAYVVILRNERLRSPDADQDLGYAAMAITLTALDEGVASCAIGALKRPPLKALLGVPDEYVVELVIALGYPLEVGVAEEMVGDNVKYWRDEQGVHHVPKRPRSAVTHWNRCGAR